MKDGIVKNYIPDRGFGFITVKNGKDLFFHIKAGKNIRAGESGPEFSKSKLTREPKAGDRIMFEAVQGERGMVALPWCFAEDWEQAAKQEKAASLPDSATKPLVEKVEIEADGNIAQKPTTFRKPDEVKGVKKYRGENGMRKDRHRNEGTHKNWKKEAGLV
jgi:cold shock CspA family protein